jgi:hypothetical protein
MLLLELLVKAIIFFGLCYLAWLIVAGLIRRYNAKKIAAEPYENFKVVRAKGGTRNK